MNTIWSSIATLMFFLPFAFGPAATPQSGPGGGSCCAQGVCEPCPPGACGACGACGDCDGVCADCDGCCEAPAPTPARGCGGGGCGMGGGCTR